MLPPWCCGTQHLPSCLVYKLTWLFGRQSAHVRVLNTNSISTQCSHLTKHPMWWKEALQGGGGGWRTNVSQQGEWEQDESELTALSSDVQVKEFFAQRSKNARILSIIYQNSSTTLVSPPRSGAGRALLQRKLFLSTDFKPRAALPLPSIPANFLRDQSHNAWESALSNHHCGRFFNVKRKRSRKANSVKTDSAFKIG